MQFNKDNKKFSFHLIFIQVVKIVYVKLTCCAHDFVHESDKNVHELDESVHEINTPYRNVTKINKLQENAENCVSVQK